MKKVPSTILSIDIGSVAVSIIIMDFHGNVINHYYKYHHGRVQGLLDELDKEINLSDVYAIISPSKNTWLSDKVICYDSQACLIEASKKYYNTMQAVLLVGAGKFQLLHLAEDGRFIYSLTNTSCAAGTGSFLDQQARRLEMEGAAELAQLADRNTGDLPEIASRCSVFAKTDLIHAQQAGYSLESICDSLCKGLAKNIADTLFDNEEVPEKTVFAGGVSKNAAVIRHLEIISGTELIVHEFSHLFPAIGAALLYLEKNKAVKGNTFKKLTEIITVDSVAKEYVYEPLSLKLSGYPDFEKGNDLLFSPHIVKHHAKVQIDLYQKLVRGSEIEVYLGVDIGSTSTKAIIIGTQGEAIAGFYTYTNGQPLNATRAIMESILHIRDSYELKIKILGAGTTGSGRKFIGTIIAADMIIDEITTHARAAHQLNPKTDTIIEIGGQDAKFTILRNGRVTFSKMNSVCAAGTGSFIEEQALKMKVELSEYSDLAENARAPLASDRCTVFMERDINHYFNQGYNRSEILAAVLHSVRDNYLKKVAVESLIGDNICFQGATAKNKALVAAFEERLGKPLFVSPYCHLTGAMGTALMLMDEFNEVTRFRGLDIIQEEIKLKTEICKLCNNNCRISVANVHGEDVAYGFLCGRDYKTDKYIDRNTSGFDLLRERKKILNIKEVKKTESTLLIGLPASLHIFEDLSFWKVFFRELSYKTISSESMTDSVSSGKRLAGAEFCAPMHSMYGHVNWLADKVDYLFLPASLENRTNIKPEEDLYCYYTQFSSSVVSLINKDIKSKSLIPLLKYQMGEDSVIRTIYQSLKKVDNDSINLEKVKKAYNKAKKSIKRQKESLRELFKENFDSENDLSVVLIGRPYLVLSESMNNGIPDVFGAMGIKTFYQDMLPESIVEDDEFADLVKSMPWHYTSQILRVARYISGAKGLYPVFITAFKCAPDSFVIEYFQRILDSASKPYLILQTDEHDSNVGYETRIEAAVRSFKNHAVEEKGEKGYKSLNIRRPEYKLKKDKIVLFPNWDQIAGRFLTANLRRHGFETRLLDHSHLGIQKGMATNTGQCLPLNIIAQDYIDYIEKNKLDPSHTILWIIETILSCNIRMYPQYISTILQNHGNGMENASVYSGEMSHSEISVRITRFAYYAYMLSGLIRRVGCKLRPYEKNEGETDSVIAKAVSSLEEAFNGKCSINSALKRIMPEFLRIDVNEGQKPLVAIFGDFFVRDNDIMNQDLIRSIEKYGGEALSTPYSEYFKLIAKNVLRRRVYEETRLKMMAYRTLLIAMKRLERRYYKHFEPILGKPKDANPLELEKNLQKYNIDKHHSGESFDNILKIYHIIKSYPDVSLFVQTNPAFCCPSLITEAMKNEIRKQTGIPIVTITYDGTTEEKNDVLAPYLMTK